MEYNFKEYTIQKLYELVQSQRIDLNPSYQRNFIWSPINQRELIDTILRGYPLPALFLYEKPDKTYEMVDGQQRTKTIYRFITGAITASKDFRYQKFDDIDKDAFLAYRLPIIEIKTLTGPDSLKEFYVLINKKGVHVNTAESNKSEFHDTNFLKLATEVLSYQNLIDLDLFTEATAKRMNDRAFIEELLAYLSVSEAKDKRKAVNDLYTKDITEEQYHQYRTAFYGVIDKIHLLNKRHPISETRYRQKNDFYTLFSFIHSSQDSEEILDYQYRILVLLDGTDEDGRQYIRPSNDDCDPLKEYAINCVTQSNSKTARDSRLRFFNMILKNTNLDDNDILIDVLQYLEDLYGEARINTKMVGSYELIDVDQFNS